MTDREKAMNRSRVMNWLNEVYVTPIRALDGYTDDELRAFAKDAMELLKEQEPVKPTVSVDTWICSKCGLTLESQELIDDKENPQVLIHEQYEYCPCCGRKVKWSDI